MTLNKLNIKRYNENMKTPYKFTDIIIRLKIDNSSNHIIWEKIRIIPQRFNIKSLQCKYV